MKTPCLFMLLLATLAPAARGESRLSNELVQVTWQYGEHGPAAGELLCRATGQKIALKGELFSLVLQDGTCLRASEMKAVGKAAAPLIVKPGARDSPEIAGQASLRRFDQRPTAICTLGGRAILRDLRLVVTFASKSRPDLSRKRGRSPSEKSCSLIFLWPPLVAAVRSTGRRSSRTLLSLPSSIRCRSTAVKSATSAVSCLGAAALAIGEPLEVSSVIGFVSKGQLRREFLAYLERERAHPYRPFLNYNTWYDLGYFSRYDVAAAIGVIKTFGEELVEKAAKRKWISFLLDDGWDGCC